MKKSLAIPLVLLVMGSIVSVVGANSYVNESSVALCMACGMKVTKSDPSTLVISSPGQPDQYACCPVCAMEVALYYKNAVVTGTCIASGEKITFTVNDGKLASVMPSTACMLAGGSCMKNKLASTDANAAALKTKFDWAAAVPVKTSPQVFEMANTKFATATIAPKPSLVSTPSYMLLGSGVALVVLSPLLGLYLRKREPKVA